MKGKMKEILIPTVALFVISLISTALLGGTNALTAEKIAQVAAETAAKARTVVLTQATDFEEMTLTVDDTEYTYYIGKDSNGETVGYTVTTQDKSYGGTIEVMTGFDIDGKITGIEILTIDDTPGLGMNAKNDSFKNEYVGKSGELTVSKTASEENEIQAITGATITSKAVTRCVNLASEIVAQSKGGAN